MSEFTSRDLMVTVLPGTTDMQCSGAKCTNPSEGCNPDGCTNPSPNKDADLCTDEDLDLLSAQLEVLAQV